MNGGFNLLAEGIWETARPERVGLIQFNHRMTVVRLRDGKLWVHSPVPLDEDIRKGLADLGQVGCLIAPSAFHDLHWPAYFEQYPQARFHCAPGVEAEHPELPFQEVLAGEAPAVWREEIDQLLIEGMPKVNEVVFLHRASGTLIVADLIFNLGRNMDLFSGVLFWLFGTYGRIAVSRLFKSFIRDREGVRRCVERVLAWEFERIVVGHGEVVEEDAREALERAYAFLKE